MKCPECQSEAVSILQEFGGVKWEWCPDCKALMTDEVLSKETARRFSQAFGSRVREL